MRPLASLHLESLHDETVQRWLRRERRLAEMAAQQPRNQALLVAAEAAAAELYAAVRSYALLSPEAARRSLTASEGPAAADAVLSMLPPLRLEEQLEENRKHKKKKTARNPSY